MQHVYFALNAESNLVKIGISNNINTRLRSLEIEEKANLKLVHKIKQGGSNLEKHLHNKFISDRVRGEWFFYSNKIKEYIDISKSMISRAESINKCDYVKSTITINPVYLEIILKLKINNPNDRRRFSVSNVIGEIIEKNANYLL